MLRFYFFFSVKKKVFFYSESDACEVSSMQGQCRPCLKPCGEQVSRALFMTKAALVCINEDYRVVSVQIFDNTEQARAEMNAQVERESNDAECEGFEPSVDNDGYYACVSYGSSSYVWDIKPVNC